MTSRKLRELREIAPAGSTRETICSVELGQIRRARSEKAMAPTPVFLPGESQGRWSLVGYCLRGRTESDTTEVT